MEVNFNSIYKILKNIVVTIYDAGLTNTIYYMFHIAAFISVFLMAQWMGKKVNVSRLKSFLLVLMIYPLMYAFMLFYFWMESGFKTFGGQHIVCIFVYAPLLAWVVGKILKIEWKKMCFIIAPLFPLNHTVGHLGCFFAGCCGGYPTNAGFYNPVFKHYYFPIQPIESAVALAIVITIVLLAKKKNYEPHPIFYPLMLVMFGSTRFILEFFRNNEKILFGCSSLSFHALFMALVGAIAIIVIKRKEKKKAV